MDPSYGDHRILHVMGMSATTSSQSNSPPMHARSKISLATTMLDVWYEFYLLPFKNQSVLIILP